jgi:hypothetical protein
VTRLSQSPGLLGMISALPKAVVGHLSVDFFWGGGSYLITEEWDKIKEGRSTDCIHCCQCWWDPQTFAPLSCSCGLLECSGYG